MITFGCHLPSRKLSATSSVLFVPPTMSNDDNQSWERDLRSRIVTLIRANEQARRKPITGEELEKLKTAANRLDQMLKAAEDADQQALRSAAARLDQLLVDIRMGKDVTNDLNLRRARQEKDE